ncbi:PAS domain-containing sensor histidine kinase [Cesiribacter andamanensis]|uniref:histidine kinase n=1 Tax=Cesiribacter andamanensis AMV16 TaxID=1279009 RepID=M7N0W7_9BACT|nr:PAS domain-containing sensor histidine kinase [Cesiribacter andamanensis]EMR02308.1 Sporulation kinase A [Cesiribacter andamanensis AMV16]
MPRESIPLKNKRAEQLQESQHFLQQVVNNTPDLIFVLELETLDFVYLNKRVEQLLGRNASFLYEQGASLFRDFLHPEDYPRRMAHLQACKDLKDDDERSIDVRIKTAEGNWCWYRIRERVFARDKKGRVCQLLGLAQDIHKAKTATETLREEHRRFKDAQAIGHIGSFERSLSGNELHGSEEFFRLHGLPPHTGSITLDAYLQLVHPDDREALRAAIRQLELSGEPLQLVGRILRPDGSIRFVQRRAELERNRQGTPVRVWGTLQDISEQVAAQEKINASEALMREAEAIGRFGSYVVELQTGSIRFSDGMYQILGHPPQSFVPSMAFIDSLSHPDDIEPVRQILEAAAQNKQPYEYERRIYQPDGQLRYMHSQGKVILDAEGNALQLLGIVRDITEQKKIQQELIEAEKLSVKGSMARTLAHEVRGPAANVSLSMELLRQELGSLLLQKPETEVYFDIVAKSCHRINRFITDLINLSISEPFAFADTDLVSLTEEVLGQAQDRIFLKGVRVEKKTEAVPPISADRERLKIALLNLVVNALEAMDDQQGLLQLHICQLADSIQLTIRDNGCGMSPQQQEKIFDMYYTTKPSGTGVGLANVKAILQDHEARIEVESSPGKGTVFTVIFPLAQKA